VRSAFALLRRRAWLFIVKIPDSPARAHCVVIR
jgi:hypothetical protein